jgi:hypothetical protein
LRLFIAIIDNHQRRALRFWPAEDVAIFSATVGAKKSEVEAVGRLLVAVVVKAVAATFAVEVAAAAAGVGRFLAAVIVAVVDGKAIP